VFAKVCLCITVRVAQRWTFENSENADPNWLIIPYLSCINMNGSFPKGLLFSRAIAVKLTPINDSPENNSLESRDNRRFEIKGHWKKYNSMAEHVNKWDGINYQASGLNHLQWIHPTFESMAQSSLLELGSHASLCNTTDEISSHWSAVQQGHHRLPPQR